MECVDCCQYNHRLVLMYLKRRSIVDLLHRHEKLLRKSIISLKNYVYACSVDHLTDS